jgi:uncharacterized protein
MSDGPALRFEGNTCTFRVKVTPRARCTQTTGWVNGVLKIKVQAPPVDGAANEAVITHLAKSLGIPPSSVEILRGETGREKTVRMHGVSQEKIRRIFPPPA